MMPLTSTENQRKITMKQRLIELALIATAMSALTWTTSTRRRTPTRTQSPTTPILTPTQPTQAAITRSEQLRNPPISKSPKSHDDFDLHQCLNDIIADSDNLHSMQIAQLEQNSTSIDDDDEETQSILPSSPSNAATPYPKMDHEDETIHYEARHFTPSEPQQVQVPVQESIQEPQVIFQLGDIVELSSTDGMYAFPVKVMAVTPSYSNIKYDLLHGITNRPLSNIDSSFLHPYRIYDNGTRGFCNVGTRHVAGSEIQSEIDMVPCTVVGHVVDSYGHPIYEVTLQGASLRGNRNMQYFNIQRIIE